MPSVVIPAHDEAEVIHACLTALIGQEGVGDLEIVVVCNGCTDDTSAVAGAFEQVKVITTGIASKTAALNLGDESVSSYPRLYLDADVRLERDCVRRLFDSLDRGSLAVSPAPVFETGGSSILVRMFYAAWRRMPFYNESMIGGSGAYALSETGRARFEAFPDVISDDGFVRLQFESAERMMVSDARSRIRCPASMRDLVRMMTRVRAGSLELRRDHPNLLDAEETTPRKRLMAVLGNPHLLPCFVVYGLTRVFTRTLAARLLDSRKREKHLWPRDDSTRVRKI